MTNKELAEKIMANIDFVGHDCECKLEYKLGEGKYVPVDDGKIGYNPKAIAHITALISEHDKAIVEKWHKSYKIAKGEIEAKDAEIERLELELIDAHLKTKDIEVIQKDKRIAELEKDIKSLLTEAGGDFKNYYKMQEKYKDITAKP